jgi:hypothetical protein
MLCWVRRATRAALVGVAGLAMVHFVAVSCRTDVAAIRTTPSSSTIRADLEKVDFGALCKRPTSQRIGISEDELDEHFLLEPRYPVSPSLLRELEAAIEELPPAIARAYERYVCSVVFVTNFGVTGSIAKIAKARNHRVVLLNVDNLERHAGAWLSDKEASFFMDDAEQTFVAHVARSGAESRKTLLTFLLIHELGHVLHGVLESHALLRHFNTISWPRVDPFHDVRHRPYGRVVREPQVVATYLEPMYWMIATSSFPSPTAAMNPGEDFADSLAIYVHSVLLGRPWSVDIYREGELVQHLGSCWDEPRCGMKRDVLEAFLAEVGQ